MAHRAYSDMGLKNIIRLCRKENPIMIDIKAMFEPEKARVLGISYWRL
jgi:hypothetical protein